MSYFGLTGPRAVQLILVGVLAAGCASGPAPLAFDNRVFYEYDASNQGNLAELLERPVDELDRSAGEMSLDGVEILNGVARFSRPSDWIIRRGSARPSEKFIEYVSPRQVVVTIYERIESPRDPWHVVLERYEAETEKQGAELLGKSVPVGTFDSQARAYDVRRGIPAGSQPFVNFSREYLVRSDHRLVLVQMVRPREDFGEAEPELLTMMQSLRVL